MTWARKDEFKKLKGKKALAVLEKLLPLPDYLLTNRWWISARMKEKPVLPFYALEVNGSTSAPTK